MGGVFAGPSASPQCLPAASPLGSDAMATATARGASRRAAMMLYPDSLLAGYIHKTPDEAVVEYQSYGTLVE
jgi:hypothetical protein